MLTIPKTSLVILCGIAGCGKSTFAAANFKPTEIVSSDRCRAMVSDNEENMSVSKEAFELFYFIIEKRMEIGRLIIADSTALSYETRKKLLQLSKYHDYHTVLLIFNIELEMALKRNLMRDRNVSEKVIQNQYNAFIRTLKYVYKEGFDDIIFLDDKSMGEFSYHIADSGVEMDDRGPFDIISDVHGCCRELEILLEGLGYVIDEDVYRHPDGRKVVFAGDIVDRGPRSLDTVKIVASMVSSGSAYYIPGNHCNKLYRYLKGRKVHIKNGLETTVREMDCLDKDSKEKIKDEFIRLYEESPPYLVLDQGRLVIAHAGIKEDMIGRVSGAIIEFVLYGDVTGKFDENGLPVRGDWMSEYLGRALVVYGHTPVSQPLYINNTINIDQGASIGGCLTAFRYPERLTISQKSEHLYYTEGRKSSEHTQSLDPDGLQGADIHSKSKQN